MKFKFTIGKRIAAGYVIILAIMSVSGIISIGALRESRKVDQENVEVYQPSAERLKEFRSLALNIEALTKNWIYQPSESEKQRLKVILETESRAVIADLDTLSQLWEDSTLVARYRSTKELLKTSVESAEKITKWLSTSEAYDDADLVDKAIDALDKVLLPKSQLADKEIAALFDAIHNASEQHTQMKADAFDRTEVLTITFTIASLLIGTAFAWITTRRITRPVTALRESIALLGTGKLADINIRKTNDEIGSMVAATEDLIEGLKKTSAFAGEIGKGNLDASFTALSTDDVLGNSLLLMRDNLKKNAEEERKRNWATAGLAKFGEILRNQDQDIEKFAEEALQFVIKYTRSNQGKLYVVNDDVKGEEHLKMIACYAFDKKKHLTQTIRPGEGLTGQCWQEGDSIYMTNVPGDFIKITSGLGSASPNNIFIVPLKVRDAIYGVLEIASFQLYEAFERELVVKLSENLAAAISTVNMNYKTRLLLEQTKQQTAEMRSQEEEMRQNLEELNATQEEMTRKEKEYLRRIKELERIVEEKSPKLRVS